MTERETLLAGIAERQARLAELDAPEWDYAVKAYIHAVYPETFPTRDTAFCQRVEAGLRAAFPFVAAFAKAPPMGSGMTEAEIEVLVQECGSGHGYARPYMERVAEAAIRETLSRVQPRWPSEDELWDMVSAAWTDRAAWTADRFMARIRAYQTGEQA
jgi:hypothetical protein